MNLEAKGRGVIQVYLAQEAPQGPLEKVDEMAPEVILVMLDQEASPAFLDQKEILEDLDLAFLVQEVHQEKKVREETAELVEAEETVGRRVNLETRAVQENQVSPDQTVNLVQEAHEEELAVMEILALREIPASQNVM